jgi:SAM-dependent methyltransferase
VCPPELFDHLAARLPDRARVVEIGCGTGQATVPLAERGSEVVAVELGERLAAFARAKLARFPGVEVVHASFEEWQPPSVFDAVVAVNAFHWVDPGVRWAKARSVLRERGIAAVVTSSYVVPSDADRFWTDVQDDYQAVGAARIEPAEMHPIPWATTARRWTRAASSTCLDVKRYLWQVGFTAARYRELLETSSWHKALPEPARRELLARIQRRVAAQPGGAITATLAATLTLGRRRAGSAA